jgi:hypothetical protein
VHQKILAAQVRLSAYAESAQQSLRGATHRFVVVDDGDEWFASFRHIFSRGANVCCEVTFA